jgi:hypothetical protein
MNELFSPLMELELKVGQTLVSQVDATTLVVVRAPATAVALTCGGAPLVDAKGTRVEQPAVTPPHPGSTLLGKRYADDESGLELLCTKGGEHALALAGEPLALKTAKPLPASD